MAKKRLVSDALGAHIERQRACIEALASLHYVRAVYRLSMSQITEFDGLRIRKTSRLIRGWVRGHGVVDSGFCQLLVEFSDNRMMWQGVAPSTKNITKDQARFLAANPTAKIVTSASESLLHAYSVWTFNRVFD